MLLVSYAWKKTLCVSRVERELVLPGATTQLLDRLVTITTKCSCHGYQVKEQANVKQVLD